MWTLVLEMKWEDVQILKILTCLIDCCTFLLRLAPDDFSTDPALGSMLQMQSQFKSSNLSKADSADALHESLMSLTGEIRKSFSSCKSNSLW